MTRRAFPRRLIVLGGSGGVAYLDREATPLPDKEAAHARGRWVGSPTQEKVASVGSQLEDICGVRAPRTFPWPTGAAVSAFVCVD